MPRVRRLTPRYVGAAYLEAAPKLAGSVFAGVIYLVTPDLWPGPWAWCVIVPLIVVTIVEPVWRWCFTRLTCTDQHVEVVTGLISRHAVTMAWADVGAVDVRQSWAYRVWRVHSVTVSQAGDARTTIQLWGVDDATRAEIASLAAGNSTKADPSDTAHDEPQDIGHDVRPQGELIYRVRLSHLLLASLAHGQFAVIGIAAALAVWEMLDQLGASEALMRTVSANPAFSALVIGVAIVAAGLVLTVVRYARFEVRRLVDGRLEIEYGLLSTHMRRIDPSATVGIVVQRNLIEVALGRARAAVLTVDSTTQLGTNLVLPSLPRGIVGLVLEAAFPEHFGSDLITESRGTRAFVQGMTLLVLVAAGGFATWSVIVGHGLPAYVAVLGTMLVVAVIWWVSRLLCSRLAVDTEGRRVALIATHVRQRQWILPAESVHVVSSTWAFGCRLFVQVHYFAGTSRALRAMRSDKDAVDRLAARVAHSKVHDTRGAEGCPALRRPSGVRTSSRTEG